MATPLQGKSLKSVALFGNMKSPGQWHQRSNLSSFHSTVKDSCLGHVNSAYSSACYATHQLELFLLPYEAELSYARNDPSLGVPLQHRSPRTQWKILLLVLHCCCTKEDVLLLCYPLSQMFCYCSVFQPWAGCYAYGGLTGRLLTDTIFTLTLLMKKHNLKIFGRSHKVPVVYRCGVTNLIIAASNLPVITCNMHTFIGPL